MINELPYKVKQGLKAFNQGNFYAAHEFFEDAWRATHQPEREFFRALLHLSGGYYRLTQDRPMAALKFFQRALHWLGKYPNPYLTIDSAALSDHLEKLIIQLNAGQLSAYLLKHLNYHIILPDQEQNS